MKGFRSISILQICLVICIGSLAPVVRGDPNVDANFHPDAKKYPYTLLYHVKDAATIDGVIERNGFTPQEWDNLMRAGAEAGGAGRHRPRANTPGLFTKEHPLGVAGYGSRLMIVEIYKAQILSKLPPYKHGTKYNFYYKRERGGKIEKVEYADLRENALRSKSPWMDNAEVYNERVVSDPRLIRRLRYPNITDMKRFYRSYYGHEADYKGMNPFANEYCSELVLQHLSMFLTSPGIDLAKLVKEFDRLPEKLQEILLKIKVATLMGSIKGRRTDQHLIAGLKAIEKFRREFRKTCKGLAAGGR